MEPWWNGFVEDQAITRAYRTGQNKQVTVVHLIVKDSIEENIRKIAMQKRTNANKILTNNDMARIIDAL